MREKSAQTIKALRAELSEARRQRDQSTSPRVVELQALLAKVHRQLDETRFLRNLDQQSASAVFRRVAILLRDGHDYSPIEIKALLGDVMSDLNKTEDAVVAMGQLASERSPLLREVRTAIEGPESAP